MPDRRTSSSWPTSNQDAHLLDPHPRGYGIESDDGAGPLACRDVRGFREALLAAYDPQAPMPQRLVIVVPDFVMTDWLGSWSEDVDRVRRTLVIRRLCDQKKITAVVTLSSYGCGVDTSLSVESISASWRRRSRPVSRSGVHSTAAIAAALRREGAHAADRGPAPTSPHPRRCAPLAPAPLPDGDGLTGKLEWLPLSPGETGQG